MVGGCHPPFVAKKKRSGFLFGATQPIFEAKLLLVFRESIGASCKLDDVSDLKPPHIRFFLGFHVLNYGQLTCGFFQPALLPEGSFPKGHLL